MPYSCANSAVMKVPPLLRITSASLASAAMTSPGNSGEHPFSGRVALRACDQAHGRDLAVPQTVLDLLADGTGAILVED